MSFTNVGVTKFMVAGLVTSSIAASIFDAKHYLYILIDPHLWRYNQFWRLFTYQLGYTNSTEVLFACMALYNMRIVERIWGSRKYASFIIATSMLTAVIPPFVITTILRPLTGGSFNYLPAGPTAIIFAILAQYHTSVPHVYQYRISSSRSDAQTSTSPANQSGSSSGITLSDKSYRYVIAIQLSMMQMPGSLVSAALGWIIGYAWKDLMPTAIVKWRLPGWFVGQSAEKRGAEFEGLRRRLEGEDSQTAEATGAQAREGQAGHRRGPNGMRQQLMNNMGLNI